MIKRSNHLGQNKILSYVNNMYDTEQTSDKTEFDNVKNINMIYVTLKKILTA